MRAPVFARLAALILAGALCAEASAAATAAAINDTKRLAPLSRGAQGASVVRAQVMLDRAWFSPGEIDGRFGDAMAKAVVSFQGSRGLAATGRIDAATWQALAGGVETVLTPYTVTAKDAAGPFDRIPPDMMERAKLRRLGYENVVEALAERHHASPKLLREINPGKAFAEGDEIFVPVVADASRPPARAVSIALVKSRRVLRALDAQGKVIAQFPISVGGRRDELPVGRLSIKSELRDPPFNYDPALIWDAKKHYTKAVIPPGPNSPIGVVWLGLSKPHYGIHGTPEPALVGRRETHGCIHLTNWDALKVAALVAPGTRVDVES